MRVILVGACAVAAVLALSACEKAEEPASKPEAIKTTGSTPSPETTATIAAMPKRKPGLWTQMVAMEGGQSMTSRICLDEATDAKLSIQGQAVAGSTCSEQTVAKTADGSYTFSSTCDAGKSGTVKVKGKATGDFNSAFNVTAVSEVTGAANAAMNRTSNMTTAARWTGPCPAGWLPGDVELPGGTRINTVATLESMSAAAKK